MTAHAHFKAGCPALALEVLSKLPDVIEMDSKVNMVIDKSPTVPTNKLVESGIWAEEKNNKVNRHDWSSSEKQQTTTNDFDWSQPVSTGSSQVTSTVDAFDWSTPLTGGKLQEEDTLDLRFSDDDDKDDEDSDTKSDVDAEVTDKLSLQSEDNSTTAPPSGGEKKQDVGDIMAQQLKFVACLKIMMEELSTLATG